MIIHCFQLRQFIVSDMHHSSVTALVWSQNAMKLYTGDEDGVVVCTEINYEEVNNFKPNLSQNSVSRFHLSCDFV